MSTSTPNFSASEALYTAGKHVFLDMGPACISIIYEDLPVLLPDDSVVQIPSCPPEWRSDRSKMDLEAFRDFSEYVGKYRMAAQHFLMEILKCLARATTDSTEFAITLCGKKLEVAQFSVIFKNGRHVPWYLTGYHPRELQYHAQVLVRNVIPEHFKLTLGEVKFLYFVASRTPAERLEHQCKRHADSVNALDEFLKSDWRFCNQQGQNLDDDVATCKSFLEKVMQFYRTNYVSRWG